MRVFILATIKNPNGSIIGVRVFEPTKKAISDVEVTHFLKLVKMGAVQVIHALSLEQFPSLLSAVKPSGPMMQLKAYGNTKVYNMLPGYKDIAGEICFELVDQLGKVSLLTIQQIEKLKDKVMYFTDEYEAVKSGAKKREAGRELELIDEDWRSGNKVDIQSYCKYLKLSGVQFTRENLKGSYVIHTTRAELNKLDALHLQTNIEIDFSQDTNTDELEFKEVYTVCKEGADIFKQYVTVKTDILYAYTEPKKKSGGRDRIYLSTPAKAMFRVKDVIAYSKECLSYFLNSAVVTGRIQVRGRVLGIYSSFNETFISDVPEYLISRSIQIIQSSFRHATFGSGIGVNCLEVNIQQIYSSFEAIAGVFNVKVDCRTFSDSFEDTKLKTFHLVSRNYTRGYLPMAEEIIIDTHSGYKCDFRIDNPYIKRIKVTKHKTERQTVEFAICGGEDFDCDFEVVGDTSNTYIWWLDGRRFR